jgi:acyl carrier protein
MKESVLEEVKALVAECCSVSRKGLSAETSLNDDLGVDGDDGVEFMQAFSERFAVDLLAFPYAKHFGPEATPNPLSIADGLIRRVITGRWSALVPLTLRDLAEAAERRSWAAGSATEI